LHTRSWNKELAYLRGYHMGGEFKRKGATVALGPVVGPLGKIAKGGRNWEGFGNDPYHAGMFAAATVKGLQKQHVMACIKHLVGNEQELHRNIETDANGDRVLSLSSNIDDVAMHELYLWPFADAIRAGVASAMCSYNRVNNSYACQNSKLLNGLLKTELGFQGFVVTDWNAQHGGVASALAGLDLAMPVGDPFWGGNLTQAVTNGSVPLSRVEDMATRILASWIHVVRSNTIPPGIGIPKDVLQPHRAVEARLPEADPVLRQAAVEGHVLVKNKNRALPLQGPRVISMFGYDAVAPKTNTPNNTGFNDWTMGTQSGSYRPYMCGMQSSGVHDCSPPEAIASGGTLITGEGSGASTPAYISAPFDAIRH
jgi:beta-glucosidase